MRNINYKKGGICFLFAGLVCAIFIYGFRKYSDYRIREITQSIENLFRGQSNKLTIEIIDVRDKRGEIKYSASFNLSDFCTINCQKALNFSLEGRSFIQIQVLRPTIKGISVKDYVFDIKSNPALFYKLFVSDGKAYDDISLMKLGPNIPDIYRLEGFHRYFQAKVWGAIWNEVLTPKNKNSLEIQNVLIVIPAEMLKPGVKYTVIIDRNGAVDIDYPRLSNIGPAN